MIHNEKFHSIIIRKHEMDLKLYVLTFKVGKCIINAFLKKKFFVEIQFDYKSKYIAQVIITKKFFYLNKRSSQR